MISIKLKSICVAVLCLGLFACSGSQNSATSVMVTENGYAIGGYDPVAYFTDGTAQQGKAEFSHQWKGAEWLFTSAQHKALFTANPDQYAPQYGGWCAYGVTGGYAAETDPENAWTIYDGKLYLNFDEGVSEDWATDIPGNLKKSEAAWPSLSAELNTGQAEVSWKPFFMK